MATDRPARAARPTRNTDDMFEVSVRELRKDGETNRWSIWSEGKESAKRTAVGLMRGSQSIRHIWISKQGVTYEEYHRDDPTRLHLAQLIWRTGSGEIRKSVRNVSPQEETDDSNR